MVIFPAALPLSMVPLLLKGRQFDATELDILNNAVFTDDIFNATIIDASVYLTTVRGIPKVSVEDALMRIQQKIAEMPSMKDRVQVFLLPEYRPTPGNNYTLTEKYSKRIFEPIFVVTSNSALPKSAGLVEYSFAAVTLALTAFTTLLFAVDVNSLNQQFLDLAALTNDANAAAMMVARILPIAGGLLALQAVHELGHYVSAWLNQVKVSFPPYFLPSLQIGSFGSILPFLNYPKDRKAMFDVSLAGPLFGFIASALCTYYGLEITNQASLTELQRYPALPAVFFQTSYLLHQWVDSVLHLSAVSASSTALHPLCIVGNAISAHSLGNCNGSSSGCVAFPTSGSNLGLPSYR